MTTTESYTTTFRVNQSPEAAFAAIINPRAWWSGAFEGDTAALGDVFTYRYQDLHYSRQEVTELVPGQCVAWDVLDADLSFLKDRSEWTGTTIAFDIVGTGSRTEVTFTHVGLKPEVECYDTCTDAWTALIQGSLKQLIETGKADLPELAGPVV
ncbi:SRPBCC family protein [Devosia alba]|uniref:SRPBCC family protein n=1 Tax=Devosia alba TaxID=3152360 RepID=UPI003263542E